MGFFDKVKEGLGKAMEGTAAFAKTTARFNAAGFCGNVNRKVQDGDFDVGSYVNIENGQGLIYATNREDYIFTAENIAGFELQVGYQTEVRRGNDTYAALRFLITFDDGKKAYADLILDKVDEFRRVFRLD